MNRTNICGMKPSTAPTPATMPSFTRLITRSEAPAAVSQPSKRPGTEGKEAPNSVKPSPKRLSFTQSVPAVPMVPMAM